VVLQPCQNFRFSEHWQDTFFMLKRTLDIAKSKGFYQISVAKAKDFFHCSQCCSFLNAYYFYSFTPLTLPSFYREKKGSATISL